MKGLKEAKNIELIEAKNTLEVNDYERRWVYKLTYQKDNTWKHIYFEDKEEADMMMTKMMEINKEDKIYSYISINKWKWEMFIEP